MDPLALDCFLNFEPASDRVGSYACHETAQMGNFIFRAATAMDVQLIVVFASAFLYPMKF